MPQANLAKTTTVDTSMDSVVIQNYIEGVPGGRTLDVTGVTDKVIKAGHVIIQETSTGNNKPLSISNGVYADLPSGHTYRGILAVSVLTEKPFASIMVRGSVNEEAAKNAGLPAYKAAAKSALSLIRFTKD